MNGNSREAVFQEIISLADAMADRLTARRRDFHKYAETGWFEMRTSSLIARRLTELGYEVLTGDRCARKIPVWEFLLMQSWRNSMNVR